MTQRPIKISLPNTQGQGTAAILDTFRDYVPEHLFELCTYGAPPTSLNDWIARTKNADGVILGWRFPDAALVACTRLQAISFLGTGIADQVSLPLCESMGVSTYTASRYGDNAVAEHTIALLLSAWNDIPQKDAEVRAGTWEVGAPRRELRGSTIGVLGSGGIARRVAQLAQALGMNVLVWSRSLRSGTQLDHGTSCTLQTLFAESDAVSIHLALTAETKHCVNREHFSMMKQGSILVNTARSDIVEPTALWEAMENGTLRSVCLDVFPEEPISPTDPLLGRSGTLFTPHMGYNTRDALANLYRQAAENLIQHFWPNLINFTPHRLENHADSTELH